MQRDTRYQAVILEGSRVLLLKFCYPPTQYLGWILPGGGREEGESEEACVAREVKEETGLEVVVERLLSDEPVDDPVRNYRRKKTYLCRPTGGVLAPGCEPEDGHAQILATGWFDLADEASWDALALRDPVTLATLRSLQRHLQVG